MSRLYDDNRNRAIEFVRTFRQCHLYTRNEGVNRDPYGYFTWLNPTCQRLQIYLWQCEGCRLTRVERSQLANPITVRTSTILLNYALRDMYREWARGVDTMEIVLAGKGDPANWYRMDIENVRNQIATSLLEIKRQYQDVAVAGIQWLRTRGKDLPQESTEKPDFQLRYKVTVGQVLPLALEYISTPQQHSPAELAAEKATFPSCLSYESLEYLLHEMLDTPEEGANAWDVNFHLGGTDAEFDALVDTILPNLRDVPELHDELRSTFSRIRDPPPLSPDNTTT
jgi:hypothetical protein